MDEGFLIRLLVVLVAAGAVAVVAAYRPRRPEVSVRFDGELEGPGVYLLTASECGACDAARAVYRRALGASGFTELSLNERPELLGRIDRTSIPLGVVVDAAGRQVDAFAQVPRVRALRRAGRRIGSGI